MFHNAGIPVGAVDVLRLSDLSVGFLLLDGDRDCYQLQLTFPHNTYKFLVGGLLGDRIPIYRKETDYDPCVLVDLPALNCSFSFLVSSGH